MEVGQRCTLRLASPPSAEAAVGVPCDGQVTVTGVVVCTRRHAEQPSRRLHYIRCTHVEVGAELARQRRLASAPSWSGAPFGSIGSGTMHSCSELRLVSNGYVSSGGYHYRYDGWYDAASLTPLPLAPSETASRDVPADWVAAAERDTAVCEVVYLCYAYQPWFAAPYAALQYPSLPEDDVCHSAYVCHRCLSPFFTREQHHVHLVGRYCRLRRPPGPCVYHDTGTGVKVYLVDGAKHLHYGRCLALLGKQLIESKLLSNDVDLYEYAVATLPRGSLPCVAAAAAEPAPLSDAAFREAAATFDAEEWDGDAVLGFFSRLKHHPDHTLSCIAVLPMFQRLRCGSFLLDVAYWMTRQRQRQCGCELCGTSGGAISRPLSPHGQSLLLSYWRRALLRSLAAVVSPSPPRRTSRVARPVTRYTAAELRGLIDIPLHEDDLAMLLLHSEFTFYQPAAACDVDLGDEGSAAGRGGGGTATSTSPRRRTRREQLSGGDGGHASPTTETQAQASGAGSGNAAPTARYASTLVLDAVALEAARTGQRRSAATRRAGIVCDRRWFTTDERGAYVYDRSCFHY